LSEVVGASVSFPLVPFRVLSVAVLVLVDVLVDVSVVALLVSVVEVTRLERYFSPVVDQEPVDETVCSSVLSMPLMPDPAVSFAPDAYQKLVSLKLIVPPSL
jgi:hypothetical protein